MLEQYYRINQVVGVQVNIHADGHTSVSACEISVSKDKLTFDKKITGIKDLPALKDHIATKFVALNLTGKGILHKQTERIEEIDEHSFGKVFPNANLADFYMQNFQSGKISFLSIIRKSVADQWLLELEENGYKLLSLSLGPFSVYNIASQLNIYDRQLIFDGHHIERNDVGEWVSVIYDETIIAPFPVKVESEPIDEKLLIAYASSFQLILADKVQLIAANVSQLSENLSSLLEKRKLKLYSAIVGFIFFLLLLVNFVVFSSLTSENAKLATQVSQTKQSTTDIQTLNDQIKRKEGLLVELGWDGGINKSGLVDQVASLLPPEITLEEVAVNPVDIAQSRIKKSLAFESRHIKITGFSPNILPVNEWIARIKTKSWVKNIQLDNYNYDSEKNTGQFNIIINY